MIVNLDDVSASGRGNFSFYASGHVQEIPDDAYTTWGEHAISIDLVRKSLSKITPDIGVFEFDNMSVNQFGFPARNEQTFISSAQFSPSFGARHGGFDRSPRGRAVKFECATPLYRPGDHIYGHWLLDILPRAWLIQTIFPNRNVTYLIRQGSPSFARVMLEAIGLPSERIIEIDIASSYPEAKALLVATNMRYNQVVHPLIKCFSASLIKSVGGHDSDLAPESIFVSRRSWKAKAAEKRQLLNIKEVETFYDNLGYRLTSPEIMPFSEQVKLFRKTTRLAGVEGSGLHNSIFSAPNTIVDALRSPNNKSLIQVSTCVSCGQTINLICGQNAVPSTISREVSFTVPAATLRMRAEYGKATQ